MRRQRALTPIITLPCQCTSEFPAFAVRILPCMLQIFRHRQKHLFSCREAGRETSTVVVFTNADAIKSVKVEHTGKLAANAPVAKVEL